MRVCLILTVAAGLVGPQLARAADKTPLEGTWRMVSREYMGKAATDEEVKKLQTRIVVKGDAITVWSTDAGTEEVLSELTFTLDPTTKPKSLDFTVQKGPSKGQSAKAIYEIEGDTLRVCYSTGDDGRPTRFAAGKDSEWVLLTYKREKN